MRATDTTTPRTGEARVSVVIVNYKGADDTITCLRGARGARLARGPARGGRRRQRHRRRQRGPHPRGLPRGRRRGVADEHRLRRRLQPRRRARPGEYVAFLNNDARPRPALGARGGRGPRAADPTIGCVASKVLDWEGDDGRLRRRLAHLVRHGLQARGRASGLRRVRRGQGRAVRHRRGACSSATDAVPGDRRLRRALLHVLRGRRPRLAAEPARPPGPLRARLGGLPPAPRVDEDASGSGASTTCSSATRC